MLEVELAHERRMNDGNVITLRVVVDVHLPVALNHIVPPLDKPHFGDIKEPSLLTHKAHELVQVSRVAKVDKDERFPCVQSYRNQTHSIAVEVLHPIPVRRAEEASIE